MLERQLGVRINEADWQKLEQLAQLEDRTVSNLVRQILQNYIMSTFAIRRKQK